MSNGNKYFGGKKKQSRAIRLRICVPKKVTFEQGRAGTHQLSI